MSFLAMAMAMAISIPAPPGKTYLPFQKESIHCLIQSNRILLGDEMGLGKTISVIGALNVLLLPEIEPLHKILILCPKSVIPNWDFELRNWLVHTHWTIGTATADKGLPETQIVLMNYDIVEKYRDNLDQQAPFDLVVCDEAHYLKNPIALRTQAVLGGRDRDVLNAKRLWFLTGSPLLNNPTELFSLLRSIDPDYRIIPELYSREAFNDRYSHRREAPWGTTYSGGRNLPELRQRLSQTCHDDGTPLMIRRTKAQVLPDLPPKRHQLLPLWDDGNRAATEELQRVQSALQGLWMKKREQSSHNLPIESGVEKKTVLELKVLLKEHKLKVSGKKKELIERLRQHLGDTAALVPNQELRKHETKQDTNNSTTTELDHIFSSAQSALRSRRGRTGSALVQEILQSMSRSTGLNATQSDSNLVLGFLAVARHETARRKVPHAIELIKNAIESSHKVVVFAFHRDVQTEIRTAFGDRAVGIMGGDSLEERAEAVRRFQTDPSVRVFVGSIPAAGTGITLSAASHVIFVEMDWSPLVMQQAEDRVHRVGQKNSVLVQYLYFPDTIDEKMAELLAAKQSTITSAIDEATGSASWVFDFGKHEGLCVADVAGSDPAYLEWIVEQGAYDRKPNLALALEALGFLDERRTGRIYPLDEKVTTSGERSSQEKIKQKKHQPGGLRPNPGSYVMTFGKHKGKPLMDIPMGYLIWLRSSGSTRRDPMMGMCLNKYLAERKKR